MEILEMELYAQNDNCTTEITVEAILFDGTGFAITDSDEYIILKYPPVERLTEEQCDRIAQHRFGSNYWKKEYGEKPTYSDSALTFAEWEFTTAEKCARELTLALIENNKNIKS